jgi:glycosyltransferase involved in cell wall biosynthesis
MNILLLGNYETDAQNSMQRFAAFMMRRLTQAGHQVRILRPSAIVGRLYPSDQGFGKWLGYVDKFGVFPFALRSSIRWADVVHICDHSNSFYTKHMRSVPHIVTCHDLLAIRSALGEIPENRTGWTGQQLQRLILNGLTAAQHIVCVSEATRKDLLRITCIPEHRVSRVYNSLNYSYERMGKHEAASRLLRLRINPAQSFLLHVGGNQWYKNRLGVLRIFWELRNLPDKQNINLVMVGKPWTPEMRRFIIEHGLNDVIFELTGVADEDLRALYSTARMLLFPSLQEGFGWPIIEAQSCGCPVLTSNRPPMDEVGGKAAVYVNPDEPKLAAVTLKRALAKNSGAHELSLENAARFSESKMISDYLSLYERVQRQLCGSSVESVITAN